MKVLVLGAGGMIGNAVVDQLILSEQNMIVSASRNTSPAVNNRLVTVQADRAKPEMVLALVKRYKVDVIVDVVAYRPGETDRLITILDGQIGHYVLLSSSDVYRNYGLLHRMETGSPTLGLLDENAPLRSIWYPYRNKVARRIGDPDLWLDAYDKIPIEAAVRRMKTDWTILRLPMVFGPEDRHRRFRWVIQPMLAGIGELEVPQPWLDWTTTYGYVGNVAAAICDVLADTRAFNSIFNVTDTPPAPHSVWVQRFAEALGWTYNIKAPAGEERGLALAISALDLSVPLALSGEKLCTAVAFKAPFDLDDGIAHTVAFERGLN